MTRIVILYALALALAATALEWLQYSYAVKLFSTDIYIALLAVGFISLGLWAGTKLTPRPAGGAFQRNGSVEQGNGAAARHLAEHDQDSCRAGL